MHLVGRPDFSEQPWFTSAAERATHADELDEVVGGWMPQHDLETVIAELKQVGAAAAPIYDVADPMPDPQYQALQMIALVPDEDPGRVHAHRG